MLLDQTVFELTEKGRRGLTAGVGLTGDARIILPMFGKGLTVVEVAEKLPPSVRACCVATVRNLLAEGYIAESGDAVAVVQQPELAEPVGQQTVSQPAVTVVDDDGLDFTGKFQTPDPVTPEEERTLKLISKEKLEEEIEARAQALALEKFKHLEHEMSNALVKMDEQERIRQEQESQANQHRMVESARLSPLFDGLRASSYFADFSDAELAEVLHIGVWHEHGEHEVLFSEGDPSDSFYVMLKGLAGVFKRERLIGLIQAGDSFGEISFLSGEGSVHHADVVTRTHVEYMEFENDRLETLSLGAQLHFTAAFARCQTRRLIYANEQIANLLTSEN